MQHHISTECFMSAGLPYHRSYVSFPNATMSKCCFLVVFTLLICTILVPKSSRSNFSHWTCFPFSVKIGRVIPNRRLGGMFVSADERIRIVGWIFLVSTRCYAVICIEKFVSLRGCNISNSPLWQHSHIPAFYFWILIYLTNCDQNWIIKSLIFILWTSLVTVYFLIRLPSLNVEAPLTSVCVGNHMNWIIKFSIWSTTCLFSTDCNSLPRRSLIRVLTKN